MHIIVRKHNDDVPVVWVECNGATPNAYYSDWTFEWSVPVVNPCFITFLTVLLSTTESEEHLLDEAVILYQSKYGA